MLQHFYPELISLTANNIAHYASTATGSMSTFSAVPPTPGFNALNSSSTNSGHQKAPKIEVHQNPAFMEDDEGIVESGL